MDERRYFGAGIALAAAILAAGACQPAGLPGAAPGAVERRLAIAPSGELRIYVARHGQTDWNADRRLQGWTDTTLNETGREQARVLGRRLDGLPIERIYSSALRRSRETAEIVAGGRVPVEALAGLNEQALGRFEGLDVDDGDPAAADEYRRRSADPQDALDGGESKQAHFERVRATLETVLARHSRGSIVIVGHGGTNTALLRALFGLSAEQAAAIHQANDELYLVEFAAGGEPRLWKYIDRQNLREL